MSDSSSEEGDGQDMEGYLADLDLEPEEEEDSDEEDEGKMSDSVGAGDSGKVCSSQYGKITVSVVQGDIATQRVDVIVCSSTGSMNLEQGAIAKAIAKQAGPGLQKDCQKKYPEGIKAGDVAVTSAGKLSCKMVYHVCLPKFRGEQTRKVLKNVVYKCLSLASQAGYKTIAFPALGTGYLRYPHTVIAKTVSSTVKYFRHRHPESSLQEVLCIIHPSNTVVINAFTERFRSESADTTPRQVTGVHIGNISVKLTIGQLTQQQSDVIVATSTRKMELNNGALSKAILQAAGPGLQTECSTQYPQGIQHGQVAVLQPGNLPCSAVYLGALPRYDRPPEDSSKTPKECLVELMTYCLQQAFTDRRATLCFPPLGCGLLKYPPKTVAKVMLDTIKTFNSGNRGVTMTVYIVLHSESTNLQKNLKPFKRAIESEKAGQGSPRGAESMPERDTPDFCRYMYSRTEHRPPPYWTHFTDMKTIKDWKADQTGKADYQLVDIDEKTFLVVESLVMNTWEQGKVGHGRDAKNLDQLDFSGIKIRKIQRVENLTLYEKYVHKQAELFHKAGENRFHGLDELDDLEEGGLKTSYYLEDSWADRFYGEVNEGYFFHGTKADRVENLLKQGMDVRLAQGQSVFGQAIYMAESSTKADQYVDEREQRQKTGLKMFLVRASLGQICVMKKVRKLLRPPCFEEGCGSDKCSHDRYDSILEEGKFIFREFVLFDNQQTYPEYIITYDRV